MKMKNIIAIMILTLALTGVCRADILDEITIPNYIETNIEENTIECEVTAENNLLKILCNESGLIIDFTSFEENRNIIEKLPESITFDKINLTKNEMGFPVFRLYSENDLIVEISGKDEENTTISLGLSDTNKDPNPENPIIYIVSHDEKLITVANDKSNLIIKNLFDGGLCVKTVAGEKPMLSLTTLLSDGNIKDEGEIDILHQDGLTEFYSDSGRLNIIGYESYTKDDTKDRYFSTEEGKELIAFSTYEGFTEWFSGDDVSVCNKEYGCFVKKDSNEELCFCTNVDELWAWRNSDGICDDFTTQRSSGASDEIVELSECTTSFQSSSSNDNACNKFGIFTLLQESPDNKNEIIEDLNIAHDFGGDDSWVLNLVEVGAKVDGKEVSDDRQMEFAKFFVNKANELNLRPIIRLMSSHWETEDWRKPSASMYADFIDELHSKTGQVYFQIHNEPNCPTEWEGNVEPDEYQNRIIDIDSRLKEKGIREEVMIISAGLSPNGAICMDPMQFLEGSVSQEYMDAIDIWGSHSWNDLDDLYPKEIEKVESKSITFDKQIMITEAGFGPNSQSGRMTDVDTAYERWNEDERVIGTIIFILQDRTGKWTDYAWLGTDTFAHVVNKEGTLGEIECK